MREKWKKYVEKFKSLGILKDMPCGYYAERKAQDDEWSVRKR